MLEPERVSGASGATFPTNVSDLYEYGKIEAVNADSQNITVSILHIPEGLKLPFMPFPVKECDPPVHEVWPFDTLTRTIWAMNLWKSGSASWETTLHLIPTRFLKK